MGKTKTVRNLAFAFAVILGLNFILGGTLPTYAAGISEEDESDDDAVEAEKKLVQYSNDWIVLQYDDEKGDPTQFDITYMGKTPEELETEGLEMQYRPIYKSDENQIIRWYSWYNLSNCITEESLSNIYSTNYTFDFPHFTRFPKPFISENQLFSLVFALTGLKQGKIF